jgi:YD repeat-containing protein
VRVADNATFTNTYDDVLFTQTSKSPIDSSKSIQQITSLDGLGRAIISKTEDGSNNVISSVSTKYDLAGRAYQTSNAYTSSPSFWTTTAFDVLGRPTSVTLPDSSATTYSYAEQTATVTDPTGKKRKSKMDAAGRLVTATEPDSTNTLNVDTTYTHTVRCPYGSCRRFPGANLPVRRARATNQRDYAGGWRRLFWDGFGRRLSG